jgi:hypothetical protein
MTPGGYKGKYQDHKVFPAEEDKPACILINFLLTEGPFAGEKVSFWGRLGSEAQRNRVEKTCALMGLAKSADLSWVAEAPTKEEFYLKVGKHYKDETKFVVDYVNELGKPKKFTKARK